MRVADAIQLTRCSRPHGSGRQVDVFAVAGFAGRHVRITGPTGEAMIFADRPRWDDAYGFWRHRQDLTEIEGDGNAPHRP